MQIKDYDTPLPHISLFDEREGSRSKSLSLYIWKPAIGSLAQPYISLDESLHLKNWTIKSNKETIAASSFTATRSEEVLILNSSLHIKESSATKFSLPFLSSNLGKTTWNGHSSYFGEARHTSNYWEWSEDVLVRHKETLLRAHVYDAVYASRYSYDRCNNILRAFCKYWCPSTNSLHTSTCELSISLWDLYKLGGLPICGPFYDEVVPTAKELLNINGDEKPSLPTSCTKNGREEVHIKDWVQFWFRGQSRYRTPSPRGQRRSTNTKPKKTFNPCGSVDNSYLLKINNEHIPFDTLNIENSLRGEVYVGAFLACWICKFLLPSKEMDHIRPSVFKVASLMATGVKFSLAIPVLASIYDGLRKVVEAPNLRECPAVFPFHYVYAWIGQYFDTYHINDRTSCLALMTKFSGEKMAQFFNTTDAEDIIKNVNPSSFPRLRMTQEEEKVLIDDGNLSPQSMKYFISQRSCFLTFRRDNIFIIELYDPCRFSRQFGFCQNIPNKLKEITHTHTLGEIIQLWECSIRTSTRSILTIPPQRRHPLVTKEYDTWWSMRSKSIPSTIIKFSVKRANEDEAQDTRARTPPSKRSKHNASPKCLKYEKNDYNTIKRKEATTNPKKSTKTRIDKAPQELIVVDKPPSMRQKGQNLASTVLRGKQVTEIGRPTSVKPTNVEAQRLSKHPY
ncbi:hypothetical protein ACH5RR_013340 [Cinchona calisaya]|uniref:Aminotransferase-like plant mobile domain-containing protein n=1 Tax=Cinchona calisaya TaxID=153742 RepID=A0ABD3A087_9GENT